MNGSRCGGRWKRPPQTPSTCPGRRSNHRLEAKPAGTEKAADDRGDSDPESDALGQLHTLAPLAEINEVGPQFDTVLLLDPKRTWDGGDDVRNSLVNST